MPAPPRPPRLVPSLRLTLLLAVVTFATTAWATCLPPQNSVDWHFVGEIVQNVRVRSETHRAVSGWSTVASAGNLSDRGISVVLSASYSENWLVSFTIQRWGLGTNHASTTTYRVETDIPPRHRVRLQRQRREHVQELVWDVVCAWLNVRTGARAITTWGRNYTGTVNVLYDAFELRTEPI